MSVHSVKARDIVPIGCTRSRSPIGHCVPLFPNYVGLILNKDSSFLKLSKWKMLENDFVFIINNQLRSTIGSNLSTLSLKLEL